MQGFSSKRHPKWWTWPNAATSYREHVGAIVERFRQNQRALEALSGAVFSRVYVAGSSAGAYFAVALALHGDLPADGYGAISGGAGRATPELAGLPKKPFYIGYGTEDRVAEGALALASVLRGAGWPVPVRAHPLGHGAREIYLDEAFAFWQ
jgi:predicted esterase